MDDLNVAFEQALNYDDYKEELHLRKQTGSGVPQIGKANKKRIEPVGRVKSPSKEKR